MGHPLRAVPPCSAGKSLGACQKDECLSLFTPFHYIRSWYVVSFFIVEKGDGICGVQGNSAYLIVIPNGMGDPWCDPCFVAIA